MPDMTGSTAALKAAADKTETKARVRSLFKKYAICSLAVFVLMCCVVFPTADATLAETVEDIIDGDSQSLKIIIQLTLIALVPSMLIMLTGFTRIVIVLSMVRNAIGLQSMPPNMVVIGLALFLTYFVMSPALDQIYEEALEPYMDNEIGYVEFAERAMDPLRDFMLKQTYTTDLDFFIGLSKAEVEDVMEVPNSVLIPAFITSELKHAFAIGFFIYIPFIVIDMVVASTLMAMGMMMLPPATISLPFKIMLFVMVDGWQLTIGTLVNGFGG